MAEPIKKQHSFTIGKKADGTNVYMIDGSEVADKATWANLRQKMNDVSSQALKDVESEADSAMSNAEKDFDEKFKAKGGKVKAGKISTHKKSKSAPNW